MSNFLESYLVKLGFETDEPSFRKFTGVMEKAEASVTAHTGGIIKKLLEGQFAIVGAFTSISAAILGTVDKVAMADQSYRLMGLRMMMTGEQARKMSMITKALGASIEEIVWDPELHARAMQLSADIDKMTAGLGPNFEGNMKSVRDFRFELVRLGPAVEFLGMSFVNDLWAKMNPGEAGKSLHEWVDWFEGKIPEFADTLSTYAKPALDGTWEIAKALGGALYEGANAFKNMIGVLSGDSSIEGTALSFENVAKAIQHVGEGMVYLIDWFARAEKSMGEFASAAALLLSGKFTEAGAEFKKAKSDWVSFADSIAEDQKKKKNATDRFNAGMALGGMGFGPGLGAMFMAQGEAKDKADAGTVEKYAKQTADAKQTPGKSGVIHSIGSALTGTSVGNWIDDQLGQSWFDPNSTEPTMPAPTASQDQDQSLWHKLAHKPDGGHGLWNWLTTTGTGKATTPIAKAQASAVAPSPTATAIAKADDADLRSILHEGIAKYEAGSKPNPISERNNNPGNLRSWKGVPTEGGYAKFPTPEAGGAALDTQLQKLIDRHLTLREAIGGKEGGYPGYASAKDHNQPGPYIDFLSKFANIDPDTPLDQIQKAAPKQLPHTPNPGAPIPADGTHIAPISYVLPRSSTSPFDRDWQAAYAAIDRPIAPSATVNHNQQSVDLGGVNIYITQPGADERKVQRAVTDGIREALFHQTQIDITQLSPAYA